MTACDSFCIGAGFRCGYQYHDKAKVALMNVCLPSKTFKASAKTNEKMIFRVCEMQHDIRDYLIKLFFASLHHGYNWFHRNCNFHCRNSPFRAQRSVKEKISIASKKRFQCSILFEKGSSAGRLRRRCKQLETGL